MSLFGSPLNENDLILYVSFVAHAIIGHLKQADQIFHQHEREIERVAKHFREQVPPKHRTLYRGLMLEPEHLGDATTPEARAKHHLKYPHAGKFISFSTDKDVACFFADPKTQMSMVISAHRPRAEGYLLTLKNLDPSRVLWTYEWAKLPIGEARIDLVSIILRSSLASRAAVIHRNLGEQCEIITRLLRPSDQMKLVPLSETACPTARELDRRFGD